MLTIENLSLAFGAKPIFENVNFALKQGEIGCLLGASGCGKTSILRSILGFNVPKTGSIVLDNNVLFASGGNNGAAQNVAAHKRNIGMVFQDYALFAHLTVRENVAFGSKGDSSARVDELLDLIQMREFAARYPHELSGGQQQRVALARAILPSPDFILLDEPFSNLDATLRKSLSSTVRCVLKREQIGALLVTHDQNEAFAMADKIGVMGEGRILQWDAPRALYERPNCAFVASLIGQGRLLPLTNFVQHCAGDLLQNQDLTDKTAVLIRPQHVFLQSPKNDKTDGKILATVQSGTFVDGKFEYEIALDDGCDKPDGGDALSLLAYSEKEWQSGACVALQVAKAWAV